MTYYNKNYRHSRKNNKGFTKSRANVYISTKYKGTTPTFAEFGISESDIETVKREYEEWKRLSTYNGYIKGTKEAYEEKATTIAWLIIKIIALLSSITGIIYGIVEYDSFGKILGYALTFPLIAIMGAIGPVLGGSFLIASIVAKSINKNSTPKHFPQQDKLDKIDAYENALKEHEYWENLDKEDYWRSMNGRTFEREINDLFIRHGYKTLLCKGGGDGGIDIIAEKEKVKIAIQCKAHSSRISPSVARDLLGTISSSGISQGYLITLNGGTSGTIEFCKNNNIVLWDVRDILKFQRDAR